MSRTLSCGGRAALKAEEEASDAVRRHGQRGTTSHSVRRRLRCRFETAGGPVIKAGSEALLFPPLVKTAAKTALVMGTVLPLINHASALVVGRLTAMLAFKILLTFLVPYAVATYGAVTASRIEPPCENP